MRVFSDDFSGGGDFWARPGIRALLRFLSDQSEHHAVIFDDIKRFARDTIFHLKLRQELSARNASPRCPTFRFEETPEGTFVETVIAATAELERKQNRRQVIRRMKARLEAGYWVFSPPIGYRFARRRGNKVLVPDGATAPNIQAALEQFAQGALHRPADVLSFLRRRGCSTGSQQGAGISKQSISRILGNELYAGWCRCEKWGIRVRGRHQALIDEVTHQRIIQRLGEHAKNPPRSSARQDFPLRGHVHCRGCRRALTGGWTRGRRQRYAYYRCQTRGCTGSVQRDDLEKTFCERLAEAVPHRNALRLLDVALRVAFSSRRSDLQSAEGRRARRLTEIDDESGNLLDAIAQTQRPDMRALYEERLASLQAERVSLEASPGEDLVMEFEPVVERAKQLLEDPLDYWLSGDLGRRKVAQNLVFEQPIWYGPRSGFCTAEFSLLYRLLGESEHGESHLVDLVKADLNRAAAELTKWKKVLKHGFPAG